MAYLTTAQRYDVLSIGDVAQDVFLPLSPQATEVRDLEGARHLEMPFGAKIVLERAPVTTAGGDAGNAAVALARLGLRVAVVTFLAHDQAGRDLLQSLRDAGVATGLVHVDEPSETNRNFVLWRGGDRTILVRHQRFNYHWPHVRPADVPAWCYLTSVGANALGYERSLLSWLGEYPGVRLAFRPGTEQLEAGLEALEPLFARSSLLVLGSEEALALVGHAHGDHARCLDELIATGAGAVVVTTGDGGAIAAVGPARYRVPRFPDASPPYERTGSDDAFAATLLAGIVAGMEFPAALRRAPANAMSVSHEIGAQAGLLDAESLAEYLDEAPAEFVVTVD